MATPGDSKVSGGELCGGLTYDVEQEAQLLVRLAQGVQEGLQASEVLEQLVDTEDPQHLHQPDDLAGLADDLKVLESLQEQVDVEGTDGQEVNLHRNEVRERFRRTRIRTIFMASLINFFLFGQTTSRRKYSKVKKMMTKLSSSWMMRTMTGNSVTPFSSSCSSSMVARTKVMVERSTMDREKKATI